MLCYPRPWQDLAARYEQETGPFVVLHLTIVDVERWKTFLSCHMLLCQILRDRHRMLLILHTNLLDVADHSAREIGWAD